MEAITLGFFVSELHDKFGGWLIKRFEPLDDGFFLLLRGGKEEVGFIFDLSKKRPGIFLAEDEPEKSKTSSPFLLLLKKYLPRSVITGLKQIELDRVVILSLTSQSPKEEKLNLILELIPRGTNAVLVDPSFRIIGAAKNITGEKRTILPRGEYTPPPSPGKINPFTITKEDFEERWARSREKDEANFLMSTFAGFSPLFAREIAELTRMKRGSLFAAFSSFIKRIKEEKPSPTLYYPDISKLLLDYQLPDSDIVVTPFPFESRKEQLVLSYPDFSSASAAFYKKVAEINRFLKGRRRANKLLLKEKERLSSLIEHLKDDLSRAKKSEEYRRYGELIIANLGRLKESKGGDTIRLIDYYHPEQKEVEVSVDPTLSLKKNAERYFKTASKGKKGEEVIRERMAKAKEKLSKIEGLILLFPEIDSADRFSEFQKKLRKSGFIKKEKEKRVEKEEHKPYRRLISSEGWEILVGKKAKDNDIVTFKIARPDDFWLHTGEGGGSHVVVRNREKKDKLPKKTLKEAAQIAAYYSKRRNSNWAFVHYTKRRHVRKPKGFAPGKVLLLKYKAITVKPGLPDKIKEALSTPSI